MADVHNPAAPPPAAVTNGDGAEYSGESVPLIPGESVPVIPGEYVPLIPEQSVPPFSCQIWC